MGNSSLLNFWASAPGTAVTAASTTAPSSAFYLQGQSSRRFSGAPLSPPRAHSNHSPSPPRQGDPRHLEGGLLEPTRHPEWFTTNQWRARGRPLRAHSHASVDVQSCKYYIRNQPRLTLLPFSSLLHFFLFLPILFSLSLSLSPRSPGTILYPTLLTALISAASRPCFPSCYKMRFTWERVEPNLFSQ